MCLSKLLARFKPLTLPHSEELMNPFANMDNTDIEIVIQKWLDDWKVPEIYHDYWHDVDIMLSVRFDYPAATFSETKEMYVRPEWANPGVLAHEAAHISYSVLDPGPKASFRTQYTECLSDRSEKLLQLLYSKNQYMKTSVVECHAEIYRFLGTKMPERLIQYYPVLL